MLPLALVNQQLAVRHAPALDRRFDVPQVNQAWGADVTYLPTREGWLYLAVVLDICSRRVIGWSLGPALGQSLTLCALEMALASRGPSAGVLHHSDRAGWEWTEFDGL